MEQDYKDPLFIPGLVQIFVLFQVYSYPGKRQNIARVCGCDFQLVCTFPELSLIL